MGLLKLLNLQQHRSSTQETGSEDRNLKLAESERRVRRQNQRAFRVCASAVTAPSTKASLPEEHDKTASHEADFHNLRMQQNPESAEKGLPHDHRSPKSSATKAKLPYFSAGLVQILLSSPSGESHHTASARLSYNSPMQLRESESDTDYTRTAYGRLFETRGSLQQRRAQPAGAPTDAPGTALDAAETHRPRKNQKMTPKYEVRI